MVIKRGGRVGDWEFEGFDGFGIEGQEVGILAVAPDGDAHVGVLGADFVGALEDAFWVDGEHQHEVADDCVERLEPLDRLFAVCLFDHHVLLFEPLFKGQRALVFFEMGLEPGVGSLYHSVRQVGGNVLR